MFNNYSRLIGAMVVLYENASHCWQSMARYVQIMFHKEDILVQIVTEDLTCSSCRSRQGSGPSAGPQSWSIPHHSASARCDVAPWWSSCPAWVPSSSGHCWRAWRAGSEWADWTPCTTRSSSANHRTGWTAPSAARSPSVSGRRTSPPNNHHTPTTINDCQTAKHLVLSCPTLSSFYIYPIRCCVK